MCCHNDMSNQWSDTCDLPLSRKIRGQSLRFWSLLVIVSTDHRKNMVFGPCDRGDWTPIVTPTDKVDADHSSLRAQHAVKLGMTSALQARESQPLNPHEKL